MKCPICIVEEIDIFYCPNCLENTSQTEAAQRGYRCQVCHECPMCGNLLGVRSQADLFYLQCNACQWTSRDLGIPDRRTSNDQWPVPVNPLNEELGKVLNIMKGLSTYERLERERKAQTTKRLSNLGILQNDRFALQNSYNLRKKALNPRPESTEKLHLLSPCADVPELDPSYLTDSPDPGQAIGLSQIISHPLTGKLGQLYPTRVRMVARRALRCQDCDTMIYKGELSPNVVKPRLQCFAMDTFPEIRISRRVQLVPGQNSAIFLTITNNTMYIINLKLTGKNCEEDESCVDASNFVKDMVIPTKENSFDSLQPESEYAADPNEISSRVMYISRNKAGICVECTPPSEISLEKAYALFEFSFTSQSESPNIAYTGEVKIDLSKVL